MASEMNRTLGVEEKSVNNCVCSRKRLVNGSRTARIWQVVAPLLFVAFGLFGVNESAWGLYVRQQYTCTGYSYSIPSQMGYTWITLQGTSFNGSFSQDVSDNSSYNEKKSGTGSAPSSINVTATMYAKPKDGYKFVGWYSSSACTGTALSTSTSNNCKYETTVQAVKGSGNPARNFYAKFEAKNYTITLNKHNGENNATVSVTFDSNKNLTTGVAVPTKTGYTFGGYYTGEDGTGTQRINASGAWVAATGFIESGKWKNAGDVTLHAKWTANKYTVTFNFNDDNDDNKATKEYTSKEVTYDAAYGSLPNPTRRFYTFDGWYTTANGGTRVTSSSSVTATSNHTLHAHWTLVPEDQTLSWGEMLDDMAKGTRQPIVVSLSANSNLTTFTYESKDTSVIKIDGEYLSAVGTGTAKIVVTQPGNTYFNSVSIERTFTVWSKETPIITENGFSAEVVKDLKVGDDVTVSLTNVSDGLNGDFKAVAAKKGGVMGVARDGNTLTFTALHAGRDTITVTQTENSDIFGATKTYYFNVTRYVPEITLSKNNLVLDETATLTINNTDGHSLSFNPQGKVSYNDETGVITALVAGTTTLTIHQPLTNTHEGKDTTFTITVSKKTPTLTVRMGGEDCTSMSTALGNTVNVSFDKVSDANVEVSLESGDQFASYKDGVMTTAAVGSAEYWATLRETDTYQGKSVKFTLTVTANTNHLPISGRSYTVGSGSAIDWTHHYETLSFSGIPEKLTFNFAYDYTPFNIGSYNLGDPSLSCPDIFLLNGVKGEARGEGNVHMIYVEESADNVHWTVKWTNDDATNKNSHPSGDIELDPTTRYVRFHHSSNFKNYYTDIAITEKKYVNDPASTTLDFGTKDINSGIDSMETLIDWCNVAPMTVSCDNPRFTVTPSGFGNYMEYNNTEKIKVFFTHTNATGTEEGDITIQNGTITKTIHVKAKTQKYQQTITWDSELAATGFAMSLNEQIPTDTTVKVIATATNGGRITFTSDKPEYVKVVADTALLAVGIGEAQVTALQVGDAQYDTVRSTKKFVVTLKQKQKIIWDQNLYGLLTTDDTIKLTASATSGGPIVYTLDNDTVLQQKNDSVFRVIGEGKVRITARQAGFTDAEGIEWLEVEQDNFAVVRNPNSDCGGTALSVASLVLDGSKTKETYDLNGIPGETITFKAKHGVKKPAWGVTPSYSPLKVEQYATINNELNWSQIFEQVVGTNENEEYSNVTIKIDQTATKIRFSTLETGTEHTIKDINLASKKFMESDIDSINQNVESNAIWSQEITVSHSDIDLMSISTKQGLLNLSATILGEGCSDYGDDKFTVSYTPAQKNTTYRDTIVITDNKAKPSTIEIPVRLYSTGLNQSIGDFVLPDTVLATNTNVSVSTTASSELDVIFVSSDSTIAYVAEGKLVILKDGIVTITAKQEGNEKYEAATPKDETVVIVKAATSITTPPTAAAITYGQALNASELTGGVGSVEGSFGWQTPATQPTAGPHSYTVVFTPKQDNLYATASTLVSVTVNQATPAISSWPTAGSITIAQSLSDSELEGGEANVEGTFAWKNPAENRLKPGTYERTMVFTPNDNSNYKKVEETVSITVTNVLARITTAPTAYIENNVYGFTLADVTIQGGAANVAGSFGWKDSTTIPQAGTHNYPIVYTPEDLELYSVVEVEVSLTVTKATPNVTTWPTATGLVYGEALSLSELQNDGEASVDGSFAWVADGSTIYNAGDHTPAVRFTPTDTDNYNTVDGEATLAVTKKALTVTADNKGVTYGDDAPANSVQYAGFVNSETSAVLGGSLAFDCDYAAGSAVGTYDIMPKGLTSSNYAITFSKGTLTVGKKTLTVTADDKNISYGAAAPDYTASYDGFAGEETASVLGGTLAFACTYKAGDDATDYTITPSGLTSGNYAFNYVAGTLHVGKAAATVTAPTAKELTYNGSAQALINAGSTEHGDILYKLGSGDWSADVPTATNAGNYTVSYKVVADANHNDVAETAVANVAIAKATPEVTAPTAINPEYTGLAQNLVNAGSTTGGTLQYSLLPSAAYSPSIPQAAFIGTYIVYYRVVGNDNYNNVDPAYISATIARPAISIVNSSSWDDVSDSTSVRIPGSTNIVIDEAVSLYSLTIEAGSKLTIAPTGSLRLGKGGITGAAKDSLVLQAVTDATKASSETLGQTSALIFSPDYEGEMPVAKVEMYSVGYKDLSGATDRDEWQYVGIPIAKADYAAKDAFPKSWVYSWNEATDSWVNNRSTLKLQPFVGVATTQYRDANGYKMTFEGQLADNRGIKEVPLTHAGEGWNLIANSFAGPIDVTKLTVEDFGGAEATIHIWDTKEDQYIELPVGSIKGLDDRQHVIPSMQAFFVQTTAATTLTLDYNRLVWGGEESNVPLKAKRNGQSESSLNGRMSISLTDGVSTDNLCLLESQNYATAYENGYDAPKKFSEANVNAIYALEDERALSVDATNSIAGTRLGLRTTGSGSYLMMFTRVEGSDDWYLLDKQTGAQMLIQEGADYEFEVESGAPVDDRFEIVGPAAAPGVATDVENSDVAEKAVKYLDNNILIIQRKGTKYNSLGQKIQ